MAFDLATAKPVTGRFDLSTAKSVEDPGAAATPEHPPTAEQIPGYTPVEKAPEPSWLEKLTGAGEAGLSMASAPFGMAAGGVAGLNDLLTGRGSPIEAAKHAASQFTYAPRSEKGREYLAKTADFMGAMPPVLPELPMVGAAARGASEASGAGRAAGVAAKVLPKADPQVAKLAKKAEDMGIPLRPDMLSDNKFARMIGDALEKVPLSGSQESERRVAFNRAVMRQIGADPKAEQLTPDVFNKAITESGKTIGNIAGKYQLKVDSGLENQLLDHMASAASTATPDVEKVLTGHINELLAKVEDGQVDGKAWREWNTKIGTQIRSAQNGDLRNALGDLQRDVMRAMKRGISVGDLAKFDEARKQYANSITLEPMVAKATTGDISPAGLLTRMTANRAGQRVMARGGGGELGDVARVGKRFVAEPPTSNTPERLLMYKGIGAAGAAAAGTLAPHAAAGAAGIVGLANLYNRLGPALAKTDAGRKLLERLQFRMAAAGKEGAALPLGAPAAEAITEQEQP